MTHIQQRRDYATQWTALNPVLLLGEVGWERDTRKSKIGDGATAWNDLPYVAQVTSVSGRDGDVVLTKTDVGLGAVNNTSDANKPVSTAMQAALNGKASLTGATFTGPVSAPSPSLGDDSGQLATTEWVTASFSAGPAPASVLHFMHRNTTSPYAWPGRPAGANCVAWIDLTEESATDPDEFEEGDIIIRPEMA